MSMNGEEEFPHGGDQVDVVSKVSVINPKARQSTETPRADIVDDDKDSISLIRTRAKVIKVQLDKGKDPDSIEGYLGRGNHGKAYRVEGKVVKIFDTDAFDVEDEVQRLELLKGIPQTIQFVDADIEEKMIITELLPGENIMHQSDGEPVQYSDADLVGLVNTIVAINEQGLMIDPKPGNFNHDEKTGFYVLDVLKANPNYLLAEQVMGLHHMLTYDGPYNPNKTEEELLVEDRFDYQTFIRQITVVRDNFPDLYEAIKRKDQELMQEGGGFIGESLHPDDSAIQSQLGELKELGLSVPESI